MGRYVLSRLAQALVILLGISILIFVVMHVLVPGDPARLVLGPKAPESAVRVLRNQLGLNEPLLQQYASFIGGAVHGDFGTSINQHLPVSSVIGQRLLPTMLLIGYGMLIAIGLAVPLGVLAAVHRNRPLDHAIRVFSTLSFAMPTFWLGLLLVLLFSLRLKIFPTSGYGNDFGEHLECLTLPAVSVGLYVAPVVLRMVRSSMIETLSTEFVEASRARGLSERRVLLRHALRNSLLAPLTVVGVLAGSLITAAVAVENVFALPGLGTLLVQSVTARDFPTVEALALAFGFAVVLINLLTDLLYVVADPRVRL
jgi:peptide/nickel transport system permease protein